MNKILILKNFSTFVITKINKKTVNLNILTNINLNFYKNKINSVLGVSGIGKSSLFKSLFYFKPFSFTGSAILYDENEIYDNLNIGDVDRQFVQKNLLNNYISIINQNPIEYFSPYITIGQQLMEHIKYTNDSVKKKKIIFKFLKLLSFLDVNFVYNAFPNELSLGMLQRISIIAAIITKPKIVIADEFLSSLDFEIKTNILKLFIKICKNMNITLIWITHNLKLALKYSEYINIIKSNRKLSFIGPTILLKNELLRDIKNIDLLF